MKIVNKKANFNYKLLETHEAGIVLTGPEVKAVRTGNANLDGAYVKIVGGEAYLVNANISSPEADTKRSRKLLLKKYELQRFEAEIKAKSLTLVPIRLYTARHLVKLEIALAKGKRKHDKRDSIKKADLDRELARELKDRN